LPHFLYNIVTWKYIKKNQLKNNFLLSESTLTNLQYKIIDFDDDIPYKRYVQFNLNKKNEKIL